MLARSAWIYLSVQTAVAVAFVLCAVFSTNLEWIEHREQQLRLKEQLQKKSL